METNMVSTLFGPGLQDAAPGTEGVGTAASLNQPLSVAFIKEQWLLVADSVSHRIRLLPLAPGSAYVVGEGLTQCPPCPAATVSKTAGSTCEPCPESTYSFAGSDTCLKCPLGARCNDGTCALRNQELLCSRGGTAKPITGKWVTRESQVNLLECPAGYLVVNSSVETQNCLFCQPNTYSLVSTDNCGKESCPERECNQCPAGARCAGGDNFEPLVQGSVWERVFHAGATKMRLSACPSGHVLVRREDRPENDECLQCPFNTYMAENASYKTARGVSSSAAILQSGLDLCLVCPEGSVCAGKDKVRKKIGCPVPFC
jgi:hypothetical protein